MVRNQVKNSPIYALTCCERELAHSNFWRWLIEKDASFARAFFPNIDINNIVTISREKNNMDLTIDICSNKTYVIENKLKSFPKIAQLNDYKNKVISKERKFEGLLTGIIMGIKLPLGWKFKSYKDISSDIKKICKKSCLSDFEKELVNLYCKDICSIDSLLTNELANNRNMYTISASKNVKDNKLGDIYFKLNANKLLNYCKQKAKKHKNLRSKYGNLQFESFFTRGTAGITMYYEDNCIFNKKKPRIGVQIQGRQFKIYCGLNNYIANSKAKKDYVYNSFLNIGWLEKYDKENKTIRNNPSNMTKDYCEYKGKDYYHIYEHWTLPDRIPYSDLYKRIIEEIESARKLVNSGKIDNI